MESIIAIVSLGGKQHLVSQGAKVVVNKLDSVEGEILNLPDMLSDRTVQVKVMSHQLGKKVNGLKFKAKTRYFKRYGHRQQETTVEVISLDATVQKPKVKPVAKSVNPPAVPSSGTENKTATKKPATKKLVTAKKVVDA
ncbi:MAG: bL21 family ribosomal protein [Patescibacteria group bacterium]